MEFELNWNEMDKWHFYVNVHVHCIYTIILHQRMVNYSDWSILPNTRTRTSQIMENICRSDVISWNLLCDPFVLATNNLWNCLLVCVQAAGRLCVCLPDKTTKLEIDNIHFIYLSIWLLGFLYIVCTQTQRQCQSIKEYYNRNNRPKCDWNESTSSQNFLGRSFWRSIIKQQLRRLLCSWK